MGFIHYAKKDVQSMFQIQQALWSHAEPANECSLIHESMKTNWKKHVASLPFCTVELCRVKWVHHTGRVAHAYEFWFHETMRCLVNKVLLVVSSCGLRATVIAPSHGNE